MSTLVTGGSGFLGSHLVEALVARGDSVRALVRPTSRIDHLQSLGVEIACGDLADPPPTWLAGPWRRSMGGLVMRKMSR